MARGPIKLRYSGIIIFLFRIISVGTGFFFTLMITRSISPEEYGIFGSLNDILSYFTLTSTIIPFWVTRFVARDQPGSFKTGLAANTVIGLTSTIIYIFVIPSLTKVFLISQEYLSIYLIASLTVFISHILAVFESAIYSKRPEKLGLGLFVFEVNRLAFGYLLLIALRMRLMGALLASIMAFIAQILFYSKYLAHAFKEKIIRPYILKWLKMSILNIYGILAGRLLIIANILLFIYGGELSRAYYGASSAIASIIGYSSFLSSALYPRLLSRADSEDVSISLKMVLIFAIPMFFGAIVLSKDLLSILSPAYSVANPVLAILSLSSLFSVFSSIFEAIISGMEKIDVESQIPYKRIVKSNLFLLSTLHYVQAAIVVPSVYAALRLMKTDALEATLYFASINAITNISLTLVKYLIARRSMSFKIPWRSIGKCFCAALLMTTAISALQFPVRITLVMLRVLVGAIIYFLILSAIDKEVRELIGSAKREVGKFLKYRSIGLTYEP